MGNKVDDLEKINNWYIENTNKFNQLDRIARKGKISFMQYSILSSLIDYQCETPSDVTKRIKSSRASISRALNVLQKKKYITKIYGTEEDQRKTIIKATDNGEAVVAEIKEKLLREFKFI